MKHSFFTLLILVTSLFAGSRRAPVEVFIKEDTVPMAEIVPAPILAEPFGIDGPPSCPYCAETRTCAKFQYPDSIIYSYGNGSLPIEHAWSEIYTLKPWADIHYLKYVGYTGGYNGTRNITDDTLYTVKDKAFYQFLLTTAITGGLFHISSTGFYSQCTGNNEYCIKFYFQDGTKIAFCADNTSPQLVPAVLLSIKREIEESIPQKREK